MSDTINRYQKVASAIYLITSFFADREPLKWKLRSLSTDLLADEVKDKFQVVRALSNLFTVAKNVGIVSDANCGIIHQELSKIEGELAKPASLAIEAVNKPVLPVKDEVVKPAPVVAPKEDVRDIAPVAEIVEKPSLREFGAVSVKKNNRQSIIIGILKRKKEIMIKDVSPLINGCSEKTIQRELLEMVSTGLLRKSGEKRWTKYTLA